MQECWHAFALALLATDYYTPELAFEILNTGVKSKFKPVDNDTLDMIEMHKTMTYTQIANIYGMDRTTVCRRVTKKPAKPINNKITNADTTDMVRLKETMAYREIGEIYGMTGQAVYCRIKRLNKI